MSKNCSKLNDPELNFSNQLFTIIRISSRAKRKMRNDRENSVVKKGRRTGELNVGRLNREDT